MGGSNAPARTTWTVYSSNPNNKLNVVSNTPSTSSVQSVRPAQLSTADLLGDWVLTAVGNQNVNIPSVFTSNAFNFNYCTPQTYSYRTQSSNGIYVSGGSSSSGSCSQSGPSQIQLQNALTQANTYALSGNSLNFRNSDGNVLARFNRPVAVASAGGATAIAAAPIVTSSNTINSANNNNNSSLVGNYRAILAAGSSVSFNVTIDSSQIGYRYCNTKGMKYTTSGSSITITPGFSTKIACSNLSPTESAVDNAFSSATSYALTSSGLTLYRNGVTVVSLTRS